MQGAGAVNYLLGTRNVAVLRGERCSERGKSCPSPTPLRVTHYSVMVLICICNYLY